MSKKTKIKKGSKIAAYHLLDKLGEGGNGDVWRVRDQKNKQYAMKILRNTDDISLRRFKSELHVLSTVEIDGVLSPLDFYLSEDSTEDHSWFTMEVAQSFDSYLYDKDPLDIVAGFILLGNTLRELHKLDIVHRDIKPANILFHNERLFFTDFGLAKYPSSEDITTDRRDVGPKFTMAPEMRRNAKEANGEKADIYSFAKTIWIALTGRSKGFDGQYPPNGVLGLKNFHKNLYLTKLDELITSATENEPELRPNLDFFLTELEDWINLNRDFKNRNVTEWFEIQKVLFPIGNPETATWRTIESIIAVLNEISKENSLNHMFYPEGGGMNLKKASKAQESGMLSLQTGDKSADLLKPKKLTYESFGLDPSWNYFRLEADVITPNEKLGKCSDQAIFQEGVEIKPGKYAELRYWEEDEYNGTPLPETSKRITRYLSGSFVFFCTTSVYNKLRGEYDAYNGQHNTMNELEFREFISQLAMYNTSSKSYP